MNLNISWNNSKNRHLWYEKSIELAINQTLLEVYKTTDIWLNRFRLNHKNIFDKIWWLSIKTHRLLAQEIVNSENVNQNELKLLLSDWNIDSNIRMELILALYLKWKKIDKETFFL